MTPVPMILWDYTMAGRWFARDIIACMGDEQTGNLQAAGVAVKLLRRRRNC
jgi:hypothetical protein